MRLRVASPRRHSPMASVTAPALTSAIIERFMVVDRIRPGEATHHRLMCHGAECRRAIEPGLCISFPGR